MTIHTMDTSNNQDKATSDKQEAKLAQANKLYQTGVILIYGKRKSVDRAIKCIQRAITFNDTDYKYWQLLGEAYYQRGSLNPAINCFMKSLKLVEDGKLALDDCERNRRRADCTYSRLRMSDIRLSVNHLDEARLGYSDIIIQEPDNVAALVGLAKTELQLARNSFSCGLVKSGHFHCMQSLKFSLKAIKLCPHLCLTWKLASDCCLIQFVYGQRRNFQAKIDEQFPGGEQDSLVLDRRSCIELAQQFLCKALAIESFQESGCLWHNLGISLYLKSSLIQKPEERVQLLKRSINCLLKALDYDRSSSQVKNSIGVVAFNLSLLNSAQHFIIKSIQCNMSTSEIQFSNLGYIYLQKGEFRLASVAFGRCQAEEPLYSRSWLGNALVNEQKNIDNLSHLRHCHRLENNYESQLMFATKVTSLPCIEEYKRDLISALDYTTRIVDYDDHSLEANNTLGLLYERCGNEDQAVIYFERALKLSGKDSRIIFNKLRHHRAANFGCAINVECDQFGADLVKTAEKLTNGGNREYILNFIFYLFKNGDFKGVNAKMTKFLDKLPQDDVKNKLGAQILLGLAAKAEQDDFKSWFFKSIIDSENTICIETVINLLCLMLLGAISNDQQLAEQSSCDLGKHLLTFISTRMTQFINLFYSHEGCWIRLAIFCSIFCLKDQSKLIRPLVAMFPTVAELWLYFGLTLMFQKPKLQAAVFCIRKANLIGSANADLGMICDIMLSILSQMASKLKSGALDTRAKYLSRALYKYPNYEILWLSLFSEQSDAKKQGKPKKGDTLSSDENSNLFYLAIDHIIKMILV